ncbi:MAG: undecaprenyl-diphosphate phosphatase, partial [Anaerolineales bacterium]
MTFLQAFILGVIQGLTEFLPISSSAHLVITPFLLNWQLPHQQVFAFDVLIQVGTLLAVIIYFWSDLYQIILAFIRALWRRKPFENQTARLGWSLILATLPAGILGLLLKDQVEAAFNSPAAASGFLFVTASLLFLAERVGKKMNTLQKLSWLDALVFGAFQALSIFPGVSRSGATISGGMLRHFQRRDAARFSFLMSIPVMLAAGVIGIIDLLKVPDLSSFLPVLLLGFISAT